MITFEISEEDLKKEITSSYGESIYLLEPGEYVFVLKEICQPTPKEDGTIIGKLVFQELDSCVTFNNFVTYQVSSDKDGWRVKQTKDLIVRLCQVTNTSSLRDLVGKKFKAFVDVKEQTKPSKEVDDMGVPIQKTYRNNDFKKGPLNKIITAVDTPSNSGFGKTEEFTFNFS